jgi:hypothetical membrane protein
MKSIITISFIILLMQFNSCFAQSNTYFEKYNIPIATSLIGISLTSAHLTAPKTYNWQTNSISQLGAQNYKYSGIMNSGFISFGTLVSAQAVNDLVSKNKHWTSSSFMLLYGTSMTLTGLFSAEPFEQGVPYNQKEANTHSLFANIAGVSLTGAMVSSLLTEKNKNKRILHIAGLSTVLLTSAMFKLDEKHKGTWQRLLWVGGIGWITLNYTITF